MGVKFSRSKGSHSNSDSGVNYIDNLDGDTGRVAATFMPLKELSRLARTSRLNRQIFQPFINEALEVRPLLQAVVRGHPEELKRLVTRPSLLFMKGQVTDRNGTIFYNVSPYEMMCFLWDGDMKRKMMSIITHAPEALQIKRRQQYADLAHGGADLVRIGKDPMLLVANGNFNEILNFKTTHTIDGKTREFTFSLLENLDGILYYADKSGKAHFYYANRKTQTVDEIKLSRGKKNALKPLFASLEVNSSRRSSNAEHQLITTNMSHQLQRNGISYERKGEHFRDCHADFNLLINAYRRSIRFYAQEDWVLASKQWREELGGEQRNVMWLLQRYCQKGSSFLFNHSDKDDSFTAAYMIEPFRRGVDFRDWSAAPRAEFQTIIPEGKLHAGLGLNFALFRGANWEGAGADKSNPLSAADLPTICNLIELGKTDVAEDTEDLQNTPTCFPSFDPG